MKSYRVITLFTPPLPPPRRGSFSIAVSVVAHVAGCVWIFLGLSHTPRLDGKSTLQRFTVRVLDVPPPEPQIQAPVVSDTAHTRQPLLREFARNLSPAEAPAPMTSPASLSSPAPIPPAASQLPKLIHQQQTLIQPDAPPDVVLLHKTPVPTVFMWTPASVPIKPVIAAPMQKSIVAKLRPSIEPPNREVNLADMRMSSAPFTTALHALPPSTTSPVVVRGPDQAKQQMPATASKPTAEPTPARVLSLSDLQTQEGPVAIPLANATARPTAGASLSAGRGEKPADSGHGTAPTTQAGNGAGQAPATPAAPAEKASTGGSGTGTQVSAKSGPPAQESAGGSGTALQGPVTRITLPKDGQYGVVVVGTSLADKYPETVNIWNGRLVYTVYLHVGAGKSWILQYSLPPGAAAAAAAGGARPDAPWPYDIVRPRFDPDDFNSDALMVHGFVNSAGRFERLALVFPEEFAKVKFLLSALQQWEFRPARENGQTAAVEVLLIIPEEIE